MLCGQGAFFWANCPPPGVKLFLRNRQGNNLILGGGQVGKYWLPGRAFFVPLNGVRKIYTVLLCGNFFSVFGRARNGEVTKQTFFKNCQLIVVSCCFALRL